MASTQEQLERANRMAAGGKTIVEINNTLGVSFTDVNRVVLGSRGAKVRITNRLKRLAKS